jgi:hypothetical protein
MILAVLGELPSIILALLIVDKEGFGRKNSLVYIFILIATPNIIIYYTRNDHLGFILFFLRFFMKNGFSMLIPFTSELYPTLYRTLGYGCATGFGRVGAFLSSFIIFSLFYIESYLPFIAFGVLCYLAAFAMFTMPFDTVNR